MIGVVCLNPALDVTHHVPAVDWAGVNRPDAVHARPGGKGLNVARTLHVLGAEVLVLGLAGGSTGEAVTAALAALAVPAAFTRSGGDRRTFTVVDGRTATPPVQRARPGAAADAVRGVPGRSTPRPGRVRGRGSCRGACRRACPGGYAELTAMAARRRGAGCRWTRTGTPCAGRGRRARHRTAEPGRAGEHSPGGRCPGEWRGPAWAWRRPRELGPPLRGGRVSAGSRRAAADTGDGCREGGPADRGGRERDRGSATRAAAGPRHGLAPGSLGRAAASRGRALAPRVGLAPVAGEFSLRRTTPPCWTHVVTRSTA